MIRERGLPLGLGGMVLVAPDWVDAAGLRIVSFQNGRTGFVEDEHLQVLVTHQELLRERQRLRENRLYQRMASNVTGYYTPETVEQSFRFGRRSAYYGHEKLGRSQFLLTAHDHGYPDSLYRAYCSGFRKGQKERRSKEKEGKFVPDPPERRESDGDNRTT